MFTVEHRGERVKVFFKHIRKIPNNVVKKLEKDLLNHINNLAANTSFPEDVDGIIKSFKKVTITQAFPDEYTNCFITYPDRPVVDNVQEYLVFSSSKCFEKDNYSNEYGRQLSLLRAVSALYDFEDKELASLILKEYMKCDKIRKKLDFSESENDTWKKIINY